MQDPDAHEPRLVGGPDPEEGAREHHPLEGDVDDAGALGEDAAIAANASGVAKRSVAANRPAVTTSRRGSALVGVRRERGRDAERRATATRHQPSRRSSRGSPRCRAATPASPSAIGTALERTVNGGSASQKASRPRPMPDRDRRVSARRRGQRASRWRRDAPSSSAVRPRARRADADRLRAPTARGSGARRRRTG